MAWGLRLRGHSALLRTPATFAMRKILMAGWLLECFGHKNWKSHLRYLNSILVEEPRWWPKSVSVANSANLKKHVMYPRRHVDAWNIWWLLYVDCFTFPCARLYTYSFEYRLRMENTHPGFMFMSWTCVSPNCPLPALSVKNPDLST